MKYQLNKTGLEDVKKRAGKTPGQEALLFYCSKCSAELYGYWKRENVFEFQSEIAEEISAVSQLTQCPVCKNKLSKDAGFFLKIGKTEIKPAIDVDAEFEMMRRTRNVQEEAKAESLVETLCNQLDAPVQSQDGEPKCRQFLATADAIKAYLQQVIRMESNIILQRKHLMLLYVRKEENEREQIFYQKLSPAQHEVQIAEAKALCKQYEKELKTAQEQTPPKFKKKAPQKPKEPEYKTAFFFNRKKVSEENRQMEELYNVQLAKYKQKYAEYKNEKAQFTEEVAKAKEEAILSVQTMLSQTQQKLERLKEEKAEIVKSAKTAPSPAKAEKELLKKEISEAEKMLKKLLDCRRALYDTNIVFPKYRNLVAFSTFYEYLCAGRCDTLEGAHGAYNLYEAECRANLIISQLNQVIDSLEQIKNNQLFVYKELHEINGKLDSLASSMYNMTQSIHSIECHTTDMKGYLRIVMENSSVIAHNTAVTAHYSKLNAELTNSLGYLVALK